MEDKAQDNYLSFMDNVPQGLYYYFLDEEIKNTDSDSFMVVGQTSAITSFMYCPYFTRNETNLHISKIPYDTKRLGGVLGIKPLPIGINMNVYRIEDYAPLPKEVGQLDPYALIRRPTGNVRDWRNESKLYQAPFTTLTVTDFMGVNLELKPHLCQPIQKFMCLQTISPKMTYQISPFGYKGDFTGNLEGCTGTSALDLPITSNEYSNFISRSKSQYMSNNLIAQQTMQKDRYIEKQNNIQNTLTGGVMGAINGASQGNGLIGSLIGGLGGGLSGTISPILQGISQQRAYNINMGYEKQKQALSYGAMQTDLLNSPRGLVSQGGDVAFSRANSNRALEAIFMQPQIEYLQKIGDFFAFYGYAQNCIKDVDIRSRKYYNFIKCVEANLEGYQIDKTKLDSIKTILEKGVTFWHIDEGAKPLDYSKDNYERRL